MSSIKLDGLDELKRTLDSQLFERVHRVTVNEIVGGAFKKSQTQIKKKWNIDIKKDGKDWAFANKRTGKTNKRNGHMRLYKATAKNNYLLIDITGTPLNLSLFEYTWKQEVSSTKSLKKKKAIGKRMKSLGKVERGRVRVKIRKDEVTTFKSAFVATMKSGHRGIYQRVAKGPLPILEKRTITPQSMFKQIDFEKMLQKDMDEKLANRFMHNLDSYLKKKWK